MADLVFMISASLLFSGCAPKYATLGPKGLRYSHYDLAVDWSGKGKASFISDDWHIDNWYRSAYGPEWERKRTNKYKGNVYVDILDNGIHTLMKSYYNELELTHKKTNATIVVDCSLIPKRFKDIRLSQLLELFNQSLSDKWRRISWSGYRVIVSESNDFAAVNRKVIEIPDDTNDSILATLSVVNLKRKQLDPSHETYRVTVLLVRIPEFWKPPLYAQPGQRNPISERQTAILSAIMFAPPEHSDELQSDFKKLISSISIKGRKLNADSIFERLGENDSESLPEPTEKETAPQPKPDAEPAPTGTEHGESGDEEGSDGEGSKEESETTNQSH